MDDLTLEELAEATQVPVRTIRYYVTTRLLPGPERRGKAATYGEAHLLRLRLIRRLVAQHVPLEEIGTRLQGLTLDDLRAFEAEQQREEVALRGAAPSLSPRDYITSLLRKSRRAESSPAAALYGASSRHEIPAGPAAPAAAARKQAIPPRPPAAALPRHDTVQPAQQTWRRWEIAPGVELHVRADQEGMQEQLIARLLRAAQSGDPNPGESSQ